MAQIYAIPTSRTHHFSKFYFVPKASDVRIQVSRPMRLNRLEGSLLTLSTA